MSSSGHLFLVYPGFLSSPSFAARVFAHMYHYRLAKTNIPLQLTQKWPVLKLCGIHLAILPTLSDWVIACLAAYLEFVLAILASQYLFSMYPPNLYYRY